MQDQWRHLNPKTREYTYRATHNGKQVKSRLDRIYVTSNKSRYTFEWSIGPTSVPTDHWLATIKYTPKGSPHIGKGRWTWPLKSLNNTKLVEKIEKIRITLQQKVKALPHHPHDWNERHNVQTLWKSFKQEITTLAKDETKKAHYKHLTTLRNLHRDCKVILDNPEFEMNTQLSQQEALIADRMAHLEKVNSYNNRARLKVKITHHRERLGGIWSNLNKTKNPRDIIQHLTKLDSNPTLFETSLRKMASLAMQYHNALQTKDLPTTPIPRDNEERTQDPPTIPDERMREVLSTIPDSQKFNQAHFPELGKGITTDYVTKALKLAKNNSTTGLDGCPYELWKKLNRIHLEAEMLNRQSFNIIKILTEVFQDIQRHGVACDMGFTKGWMCPIFKKKDRMRIENYHLITLLNSDYKLFTKALSLQLLDPIEEMIHRDQARFIPGRSIFDHIRLTRVMITYAETMEVNRAIIALDQEKAYDKITHRYLWKTLEAFNFLEHFIDMVKSLYQDAKTTVAINRELSNPFSVQRGVRQGDPLSCFLFNLGIEPLVCMI